MFCKRTSLYCSSQRSTNSLHRLFTLTVPSWPTQSSSWVLNHLQESAKNTSLPSLFDPRPLALSILIVFFKKKKNLPLLDLHTIHLLSACFLKKKKKLTLASLLFLYSICIFYCISASASASFHCISVWYSNATNQDCKALQRVVRLAERISGSALPSLQDIYLKRCKSRAAKIIKDSNHPGNRLFITLPSGKRFRAWWQKLRDWGGASILRPSGS